MIISDDKRFIFVHIEKTAGTSIGQVLAPYANQRPASRLLSLLRRVGLPRDYHRFRFGVHAPLCDVQAHMPEDRFAAYYKFAFVRNPWDRLVSEYNAALKKKRRRRHARIASFGGFEDFIRYEIRRGKFFQLPRLCGRDGRPAVDFIGRFEAVERDFDVVCQRLGIENRLGKFNVFPHASYRHYYDDKTRELVREFWRPEIEYFGYDF